jgi:hypothetical protein
MGMVRVVLAAIILFSIFGATLWITRVGLEKFIDFVLQRKTK